jgi:hypothetical protein
MLCAWREQACHATYFLKCLHKPTPFDGHESVNCSPNISGSVKWLFYRCVAIQFRSSSTSLLECLILIRWFVPWFWFLFDSTLQSWCLALAIRSLRGFSLVCCSSTLQPVGPVFVVCIFWGWALVILCWRVSFLVVSIFPMVGVPAFKFYCRPYFFVLLLYVPRNHVSCYVEGFMKSSWEPS